MQRTPVLKLNHSGKLKLTPISPRVISITPQKFFWWAGLITVLLTHGSRINTDRSPTSRAFRGHGPQGNFLDFNSPKVPFPGFLSHSDRIFTDCPNHYPDFDLESLKFFTKHIFILWKIWPISVKRCKLVWIHACFSNVNFPPKNSFA